MHIVGVSARKILWKKAVLIVKSMSPPLLKGVHIQLSWDQPVAPKRGKVPI